MSISPLVLGLRGGFKPDDRLTVDEWSDKFRVLTSESSAESGKWRTDRTPYLREIMQVMSPSSSVQQVKVIKGTQLGFSSVADNIVMCYLDYYPCPILYILPTETLAKGTSKRRITPSLSAIPHLRKKIIGGKSKSDIGEVFSKSVSGGNLTFGWSQSTASFRSFSARIVILDDVDGFGTFGEGDVMELAKARADAFQNKKIYINSTPTVENKSNIDIEFLDSDQREYFMKCPFCEEEMRFLWEYMVYEINEKSILKNDVECGCPNCGSSIKEFHKNKMMHSGKWLPQNEGHPHRGYKLTSFYSPYGWLSWNQIAIEFNKAHRLMKKGDNKLMQVWQNTRNAIVWKEVLDGVEIKSPDSRVEKYSHEVPKGVYVLSAGVDSQDDRFEVEVVGHGKNGETWSIDYKVIAGDPKFKETQAELDKYLQKTFKGVHGTTYKIQGTCIDTGGHRTKDIYEYCRVRTHMNIFAIKGSSNKSSPVTNKVKYGNYSANKLTLFILGVSVLKDSFYATLSLEKGHEAYCHFPNKNIYDVKYFNMLTAEKRNSSGNYIKVRARNEAIDCRVYAIAAIAILDIDINSLSDRIIYQGEAKEEVSKSYNNHLSDNYLEEY